MSFYHTNTNICIKDILDVCDIKNFNELDLNFKFSYFLRNDLASYDDLTFVSKSKYITETNSKYLIANTKSYDYFDSKNKIILISKNIDLDVAKISNLFYRPKTIIEISNLNLPKININSQISKNSVIENGVVIGNDCFIDDFSSIGHNCSIGNNVKIGKNVSITNSIVGDNVSIGDGTKIGQSGFGFTYDSNNIPIKIFHIGRVIIQNNVKISCNCTVDRGSFNDTVIGENTFIDNLVHIAHNVTIGNNCMIAGQCGFAGSSKIGNFVQIGGQSGIGGHINVSDFVKIAAKSGVVRDIPKGEKVMGYPAINLNKYLKNYKKNMM